MKTIAALLFAGAITAGIACATEVPHPGKIDHRVREVDYNPDQVYELTGFYGYHVTITFQRDEVVEKIAAGYAQAWDINQHGWFITVKPRDLAPHTSLVVTTNRRMYAFDLRAKKPPANNNPTQYALDPQQIFVLRFKYPQEERTLADAARARMAAQNLEEERRLAILAGRPPRPSNRAYFYQGSEAIAPYEAWDDGTFTYFRFYAQQDLPSVFVVNDDGTESIANKHFVEDVMVIQRVARQMRLRKGASAVCVYNENPEFRTPQPVSGASEDGAERVNRGR